MNIRLSESTVLNCDSVIIAPDKAVEEAGYILSFSEEQTGSSKHVFHAMAQMAYFQYQDDEIEIIPFEGEIDCIGNDFVEKLDNGLFLFRTSKGEIGVVAEKSCNIKKLLETVYRYCTRWVRLDI